MENSSQIVIYQTERGQTKIEVRLDNETVWLTQKLMAELFQTTPQNITLHLKNIFKEEELEERLTCKDFLQVQQEGSREVSRKKIVQFRCNYFSRISGKIAYSDQVSSMGNKTPKRIYCKRICFG